MSARFLQGFILVCLILGIVTSWFSTKQRKALVQEPVACTMEAKICPDGSTVGRQGPSCEFAACPTPVVTWQFTSDKVDKKSGAPQTKVAFTMRGVSHDVGTEIGTCSDIASSSWQLLPNEKAGAICWFAGGGTEIGIFEEQNKLVVKKGQLDEGTAEEPGIRGDFKELFTI